MFGAERVSVQHDDGNGLEGLGGTGTLSGGGVGTLEAIDPDGPDTPGSTGGPNDGNGNGRGRGRRWGSGGGGGGRQPGGRPSGKVIGAAVAAVAVAAAGISYAISQSGGGKHHPAAITGEAATASGPMHVVSVTPASKTTGVNGAAPVAIAFSAQVAGDSPKPEISPSVPGQWTAAGDDLIFTLAKPFTPSTKVTVTIPDGPTGVHSATGALLAAPVTEHFTTGGYSQAGLATLLAKLGYLPMSWSPTANGAVRAANLMSAANPAAQTAAGEAYNPPAGQFTWDSGYPALLKSMWSPDQANVVLRGAVMAFQSQHNETIDGSLTPQFWRALFKAEATGQRNANGYTYAIASKHVPETLTIYHNGHVVMRSLANTGIPVSPTVDGTFPVYERFRFQIMRGTNPDGSSYADPVSFVSYFNGGDAVHYFPRGSYGFQQSLGCVELPWNSAARAFPYLTYGSLVTVTG